MMTFTITDEEYAKIIAWSREQDEVFAKKQGRSKAYYGAIGGELKFEFTPTGVGTICKAVHGGTGEKLDFSDYDNW